MPSLCRCVAHRPFSTLRSRSNCRQKNKSKRALAPPSSRHDTHTGTRTRKKGRAEAGRTSSKKIRSGRYPIRACVRRNVAAGGVPSAHPVQRNGGVAAPSIRYKTARTALLRSHNWVRQLCHRQPERPNIPRETRYDEKKQEKSPLAAERTEKRG